MYVKFSKHVGANKTGDEAVEDAYEGPCVRGVSDSHGMADVLVVPRNVHLYEGRFIKYRKYRVASYEEVDGLLKGYGYCHTPFGLPTQSFKPDDQREELIVMEIFTPNEALVCVVAWGPCSMFVMNSSGKTIDSISCA